MIPGFETNFSYGFFFFFFSMKRERDAFELIVCKSDVHLKWTNSLLSKKVVNK